ncbi:hypothetical protein QTP88_006210 [Uroleucon formosanum]
MYSKHKQIKFECMECGSILNNDYRLQHERTMHGGKRVKIQYQRSPLNPFVSCSKNYDNEINLATSTSTNNKKVTEPKVVVVVLSEGKDCGSWINCTGKLPFLTHIVKECNSLFEKVTGNDVPNPIFFLTSSIEPISDLKKKSDDLHN